MSGVQLVPRFYPVTHFIITLMVIGNQSLCTYRLYVPQENVSPSFKLLTCDTPEDKNYRLDIVKVAVRYICKMVIGIWFKPPAVVSGSQIEGELMYWI